MAEDTHSGAVARTRRTRIARAAALALVLAALVHAAALAVLSTPALTARLRERAVAGLRARVGAAEVERARVDWRLGLRLEGLRLAPRAGADVRIDVEAVRVGASLRGLLAGRLEPGRVALRGVTVTGPVALGPFDVDARVDGGERVVAEVRLSTGGRASVTAARGGEGWRARVSAAVGAGDLPALLRSESARVASGALALDLDAGVAPDLSSASGRVRIAARDVFLDGRRVAAEPVGPLRAEATGELRWEAEGRRLALRDGVVSLLGAGPVALSGELRATADLPFSLSARAADVDFAAAVAALPAGLAPPAGAPRPPGTLDARLDVSGPLATPARWLVDAALDLSNLRALARRAPCPLRGPFAHRPPDDPARVVRVDPASPDFVPIAELPEHVVRAVTTSEDAGFFAHEGFDFEELRNALAEGTEAGRVVRGGSTITQQLAKNLFLSPERTLARKVREATLAIALEASVPKRRLLEIYLNVAEWGPGLFGIGPAARHWFGKDARELTPKEAAFLASIIPSPVRYHAMYARGFASDAWEARVNDLLFRMTAQGALTDDELVEGLEAPISFGGG
jgi:penicillin-binding protein 1A